jgi:uncharacterized protein YutD
MEHLQKEHDFFNKNYAELIEKYQDKYVVISDESLKNSFEMELDAYIYGLQNFGAGNFILKHCVPLENQILQTYNNRIIF